MAAQKGPLLKVKVGDGASSETFTLLAGVRSKTVTDGVDLIDATTDTHVTAEGANQRVNIPGLLNFGIEVAGIAETIAISQQIIGDSRAGTVRNYQVEWTDVGMWAGAFFIANLQITGSHEGLIEFSCTLAPQQVVTWTDAS